MSEQDIHRVLQRQLKKAGVAEGELPEHAQWERLLRRVSEHYARMEEDRRRLTRSLETTSSETQAQVSGFARQVRAIDTLLTGLTESFEAFDGLFAVSRAGEPDEVAETAHHARDELLSRVRDVITEHELDTQSTTIGSTIHRRLTALDERLDRLSTHLVNLLIRVSRSEEMKRELEVMGTVEEILLPRARELERPTIQLAAMHQRASASGSEWWDAHDLPDGRVMVVVGDVSSGGVAAAIMIAAAKSACELLLSMRDVESGPREILEGANTAVRRIGDGRVLMSCALGIFDPRSLTLTWANAGHVSPLLVRRLDDRAESSLLVAHGAPLGSTEQPTFETATVPLQRDDLICFYSAGLAEARNRQGQRFGEQRLRALVEHSVTWAAGGIRDAVQHALGRFTSGTTPTTDWTLLVAKMG